MTHATAFGYLNDGVSIVSSHDTSCQVKKSWTSAMSFVYSETGISTNPDWNDKKTFCGFRLFHSGVVWFNEWTKISDFKWTGVRVRGELPLSVLYLRPQKSSCSWTRYWRVFWWYLLRALQILCGKGRRSQIHGLLTLPEFDKLFISFERLCRDQINSFFESVSTVLNNRGLRALFESRWICRRAV